MLGSSPAPRAHPGREGGRLAARPRRRGPSSVHVFDVDSLLPPPIDGDLASLFEEAGAEVDDNGVALSFGNDSAALDALPFGLLVFDRTHGTRLRVGGAQRAALLQPLCSGELAALQVGGSVECLLALPEHSLPARVLALESSLLLLLPQRASAFAAQRLRALAAAASLDASVDDVSLSTASFVLLGPGVAGALRRIGLGGSSAEGTHALFGYQGSPCLLLSCSGLASHKGVTLVVDESVAGSLWATLTGAVGALPAGERVWGRLG